MSAAPTAVARILRLTQLVSIALSAVVCGGAGASAEDASAVDDEGAPAASETGNDSAASDGADASPEADDTSPIPDKCAKQVDDVCLPPERFVKKMCNGDYPAVAMQLFAGGTPWTRAYLTHETEAWNASGGGSSNEKLALDEEVIVLRFRKPSSEADGIQVSGASGGYDALRWDGMCVTLDGGELRFDPPSNPRNARLVWTRIEMDVREALKEDAGVREAYIAYRKECKGVTVGAVTKKCVELDTKLSRVIASYVRASGKALPTPKKLPE